MRRTALVLCAGFLCACSGGNLASELAEPPAYEPKDQSKCKIKQSQSKPLIVEWPSAERVDLEAGRQQGVVVVRYDGCEMQLLTRCKAPGSYGYQAVAQKQDTVVIKDEDELYANIPMGAARFEAKLAKSGQLNVAMTMVGRWMADTSEVKHDQLEGTCEGATHILGNLTVGAFEFFAGTGAEVGAGVDVMGAGAGAKSTATRETLTKDGDPESCTSETGATEPPLACSALLRVEVVPLDSPKEPKVQCPAGSQWDGSTCVGNVGAPAAEIYSWPLGTQRFWKGTWHEGSWQFTFSLTLLRDRNGTIEGQFDYIDGRSGKSGTEWVRGDYAPTTGRLNLTGQRVSPGNVVFKDVYELNIDASGGLTGRTLTGNKDWGGRINGKPSN